ncbi:MAG: cold shock domain-containing protein [Phycisphaeraceae bacterium]|nr:cold shock domain-containing protein [Phycisphaeraceae bacterium]
MTIGKVKWFDPKKGYGFIVGPEEQDVFVHFSHIGGDGFRSLKDGEDVQYELIEGEKGWQAREVLRTAEPSESSEPSEPSESSEAASSPS